MTETLKCLVFRIPEKLKRDFRIALLKNNVDVQHSCEAFAEAIINYTNGERNGDCMKSIIHRAQTLTNGV